MKIEGIYGYKPVITKLGFSKRGMIDLYLKDGRIISFPKNLFSDLKKLTPKQLHRWYLIGGEGFYFDDCNEVFHIEQILGKYDDYKYRFVNEPQEKYRKKN